MNGINNNNNNNNSHPLLLDLSQIDGYLFSLLKTDLSEISACFVEAWKQYKFESTNTNSNSNSNVQTTTSRNHHHHHHNYEYNNNTSNSNNDTATSVVWIADLLLAVLTASSVLVSKASGPAAASMGLQLANSNPNNTNNTEKHPSNNNNSSSSNATTTQLVRRRLLLYTVLRVVSPRVYELFKTKARSFLESNESQEITTTATTVTTAKTVTTDVQVLAAYRKRFAVGRLLLLLDGAKHVLRLGVLLSFWKARSSRNDDRDSNNMNNHGCGGDVALWLSGLSYTNNSGSMPAATTKATTKATTTTKTPLLWFLFVLYSHRRWLHREATRFLWTICGRGLLSSYGEVGAMVRGRQRWWWWWSRQWWWWKKKMMMRRHRRCNTANTSIGSASCWFCLQSPPVVPYRLEGCSCGGIACYTCLWEKVADEAKQNPSNDAGCCCPICFDELRTAVPI